MSLHKITILGKEMNEAQKAILDAKKSSIQTKLKVKETIQLFIKNWLEVYDMLLTRQIPHQLHYLTITTVDEKPFWLAELELDPLKKYEFTAQQLLTDVKLNVKDQLFEAYPNTYPLRYMPALPALADEIIDCPAENLIKALEQLHIQQDEIVYLIYLYYQPIIKISLADLKANAQSLLDFPFEDIVITPLDFRWMIFKSMEDEWRCGC